MIFDIFVILLAAGLAAWSFLRESRRKTIIRLLSLFLIMTLVFAGKRIPSFTGIVTVSNTGSYSRQFAGISKWDRINEYFGNYFHVMRSDTALPRSVYHFSDNAYDNDIYINENDTGIDTAYADSGLIHVVVRAMNGEFIPCTLHARGIAPIPLSRDTHIIIRDNTVKYVKLHCRDINPFNEFFDISGKPRILLIDTVYSRKLQTNVFMLEGMYPEYDFSGAILRNKSIISSAGHYNGIIFISSSIDDSVPYTRGNPDTENGLREIGMFLDNHNQFSRRIVNPFNSGRDIRLSLPDKFILTFKNHPVIVLLILLSVIAPVI